MGAPDFEMFTYTVINNGRAIRVPMRQDDGSILRVMVGTGKEIAVSNQEQYKSLSRFPRVDLCEHDKMIEVPKFIPNPIQEIKKMVGRPKKKRGK